MKLRLLIDKILTFICIFVPSYLLCNFFTQNIAIKSILSAILGLLGLVIISFVQKMTKSRINYKNFALYTSVHGAGYIYDKLVKAFSNMEFENKGDYLISPDKIMIICSAKFGNLSPDEILKYNKLVQKEEATKCYLIAKELPKNCAIALFNFTDKIKYIPLKIVFKMLKSQKLLDEKINVKLGKLNYSNNIFDIIFDKSNIKKFLFVAIILYAFSFIIPFKTYYIVLGSINIALAIICVVRGRSHNYNGKYEIFDKHNNK